MISKDYINQLAPYLFGDMDRELAGIFAASRIQIKLNTDVIIQLSKGDALI